MTTDMPETLYALEGEVQDPTVRALNRIATALEQLALARLDAPVANVANVQPFAPLPRPTPILAPATVCPTHNAPWKIVPAGVSKRTGQTYESFAACPVQGCDQRPPR